MEEFKTLNVTSKQVFTKYYKVIADIFACLIDLNFKQSKLTRLHFLQTKLA
jgi:hypothetical protein